MELELSLSPPNQRRQPMKKSSRADVDRQCSVTRFPLVSWNQDEDDDEHSKNFFHGDYPQDMDDDRGGLNGWPPLHSWRKRYIEENHFEGVGFNGRANEERGNINVMNNNNNNNNYTDNELLFVKVKMDGVGIARKIDLNAFRSYQTLTTTLIHMFNKEIDEDGASYMLMYQHKDGHWLLAGDLPWEMFIRTVKRIRIIRN